MNIILINNYKYQSGAVLVISLVFLLIMTIISVTAMKVTNLEEKMAGNSNNHNLAFQSAESALRDAEAYIDSGATDFNPLKLSNGPFQNTSTPICVDGLCGTTSPLQSESFSDSVAKIAVTGTTTSITEPIYVIELIRTDPSVDSSRIYATFRITARAWGATSNSSVLLQSTFRLHAQSFIN